MLTRTKHRTLVPLNSPLEWAALVRAARQPSSAVVKLGILRTLDIRLRKLRWRHAHFPRK
jgi:hypothetical protein